VESIDNIIDLAAERARRAPPSPPPLAPEGYDFRVIACDAQGKLKLVTGTGAFDDFEEAAAFAVTLMGCWQADYAAVDICTVVDGELRTPNCCFLRPTTPQGPRRSATPMGGVGCDADLGRSSPRLLV
jgi:hypothetical protein